MVTKHIAPYKINESVYWVGSTSNDNSLQVNIFLIFRDNIAVLIDPGPVPIFKETLKAVRSITSVINIKAIIVSHQDPDICASLPLWEQYGFSGCIIAHWRTAMILPSLGISSEIRHLSPQKKSKKSEILSLQFITMPFVHAPGTIATYDSVSKTFFSSDLFGAFGKNLNLYADNDYKKRMVLFHKHYIPSAKLLNNTLNKIESLEIQLLCPQHGCLINNKISELISALRKIKYGTINSDVLDDFEKENDEIEKLRKKNFELEKDLVLINDDKLVDQITKLYNTKYFNSYIPLFIDENINGCIINFRLDEISALNKEYSFSEGDKAIAVFSRIISENKPEESFLFRGTGPMLILMLPETRPAEAKNLVKFLQAAVANSDGFITPMTTSATIVFISELDQPGKNPQTLLKQIIRKRLSILDKLGKNSLCDATNIDPLFSEKEVLLIIESDMINANFLADMFKQKDYLTITCNDGYNALHTIDINRPSVIISEINISQMDVFRLRKQLMDTEDLRNIPFILISHLKTDTYIERAYKLKMRHYLKKPISFVELNWMVKALIEESNGIR